jgi:hypothetical protein
MERCSHHWCIRLWSVTRSFFPSVHVCPSRDACWPMLGDRSFWVALISTLFTPFLKRQQHFLGFSDPAPTSAPSKKSRSGISWMGETVSYLVGIICKFFFPSFFLFFIFFFLGTVSFLVLLFLASPLTPIFIFGNFLPPPPTYLLPFLSPTHLPPSRHPPPSPLTFIVKV